MSFAVTDEWVGQLADAASDLPACPGATATIEFSVGGDGGGAFVIDLVDGVAETVAVGSADDPDFVLAMPVATLQSVLTGDLELEVGYMRGEIKVTGNIGRMLSVLPVTTSAPWRSALAAVAPA